MKLTSSAFADGESIPARYTCDGANVSPPLAWEDVPEGAQAFVLTVLDRDASDFVHWLLSNIPGEARELSEGQGDAIGTPGPNSFRSNGWGGPCPPSGEHRYVFTLYALSAQLSDAEDIGDVLKGVEQSGLGKAELTGVYKRGG
jgi:Raf kinase inhibitor-like YbhB/YbcL family protein